MRPPFEAASADPPSITLQAAGYGHPAWDAKLCEFARLSTRKCSLFQKRNRSQLTCKSEPASDPTCLPVSEFAVCKNLH